MSEGKFPSYKRICELAESQRGFVARRQLRAAGLSRTTIESWTRTRRLIRVWQNVYALGHVPTEPRARAFGAVLAAGERSALAGWSAGAFYGLAKRWPEPVELISPRQVRIMGLSVDRCSTLNARDIWPRHGLRVTSPARTALDLAPSVDAERLHGVVDGLRLQHGLTIDALADVIARNPRHPGARRLAAVVGVLGRRASRSALERRWPKVAAQHGLTPYEQNVRLAGHEVDVLIDGLVVVEIDTFATHLLNFASDRHRDARILAATGIPTIRLLDTDLDGDMTHHAAHIRATLARRRRETQGAASASSRA